MDYFTDVLATFLALNKSVVLLSMQGQKAVRFHKKNILICVLKMNEGLTGLEWHEGEYMTEFSFMGELSL